MEDEKERKTRRDLRERKRGGKERRARLAAGGSNCVINLKVRFSGERTGGEKGRGAKGEEEEREGARDIRMLPARLCRGVRRILSRHRIYLRNDSADTELQVNRHRRTHPMAARDERPWIRYRYCYYGGSTVRLAGVKE